MDNVLLQYFIMKIRRNNIILVIDYKGKPMGPKKNIIQRKENKKSNKQLYKRHNELNPINFCS